ncbi:olfactory receptor 2K2-like [Spinachia spinachia]
MENATILAPLKQPIVFHLEGFYVPPGYGVFFFFLALLCYVVIMLANGVVLCVIVVDKNLHRPMYIMVCNLVVSDLLGATAVLPRLMMHFLMDQKKIGYVSAIAQAFSVHTYGFAVETILAAMAYDRYIAVCEPLRYHAIMTSTRLHFCLALAWITAFLFIGVLFILHINSPLCGNIIHHVYCSNRGILNLACSPTPINNIYGLCIFWFVNTSIFLIIAFSYIRILHACLKQGRDNSFIRSKTFQTCTPHLVVYVLYQLATVIIVVSQRFPSLSQNIKKFVSILFIIFPPAMNPMIYGLVSKDIPQCPQRYAAFYVVQHERFGGGSVMVWGGVSTEGRTDLYRLENSPTAIRHRDEMLEPKVRPYAGAPGPQIIQVHDNARPHVHCRYEVFGV